MIFKCIIIIFIVVVSCKQSHSGSNERQCGDIECTTVISEVKTIGFYKSKETHHLTFKRGAIIKVIEKSVGEKQELWGGYYNKKFGYFPKSMVQEMKVFKRQLKSVPTNNAATPTKADPQNNLTPERGSNTKQGSIKPVVKPDATGHQKVSRKPVGSNKKSASVSVPHSKLSNHLPENVSENIDDTELVDTNMNDIVNEENLDDTELDESDAEDHSIDKKLDKDDSSSSNESDKELDNLADDTELDDDDDNGDDDGGGGDDKEGEGETGQSVDETDFSKDEKSDENGKESIYPVTDSHIKQDSHENVSANEKINVSSQSQVDHTKNSEMDEKPDGKGEVIGEKLNEDKSDKERDARKQGISVSHEDLVRKRQEETLRHMDFIQTSYLRNRIPRERQEASQAEIKALNDMLVRNSENTKEILQGQTQSNITEDSKPMGGTPSGGDADVVSSDARGIATPKGSEGGIVGSDGRGVGAPSGGEGDAVGSDRRVEGTPSNGEGDAVGSDRRVEGTPSNGEGDAVGSDKRVEGTPSNAEGDAVGSDRRVEGAPSGGEGDTLVSEARVDGTPSGGEGDAVGNDRRVEGTPSNGEGDAVGSDRRVEGTPSDGEGDAVGSDRRVEGAPSGGEGDTLVSEARVDGTPSGGGGDAMGNDRRVEGTPSSAEGDKVGSDAKVEGIPSGGEGDAVASDARVDGTPSNGEGDAVGSDRTVEGTPSSAEGDKVGSDAKVEGIPSSAEGDKVASDARVDGTPTGGEGDAVGSDGRGVGAPSGGEGDAVGSDRRVEGTPSGGEGDAVGSDKRVEGTPTGGEGDAMDSEARGVDIPSGDEKDVVGVPSSGEADKVGSDTKATSTSDGSTFLHDETDIDEDSNSDATVVNGGDPANDAKVNLDLTFGHSTYDQATVVRANGKNVVNMNHGAHIDKVDDTEKISDAKVEEMVLPEDLVTDHAASVINEMSVVSSVNIHPSQIVDAHLVPSVTVVEGTTFLVDNYGSEVYSSQTPVLNTGSSVKKVMDTIHTANSVQPGDFAVTKTQSVSYRTILSENYISPSYSIVIPSEMSLVNSVKEKEVKSIDPHVSDLQPLQRLADTIENVVLQSFHLKNSVLPTDDVQQIVASKASMHDDFSINQQPKVKIDNAQTNLVNGLDPMLVGNLSIVEQENVKRLAVSEVERENVKRLAVSDSYSSGEFITRKPLSTKSDAVNSEGNANNVVPGINESVGGSPNTDETQVGGDKEGSTPSQPSRGEALDGQAPNGDDSVSEETSETIKQRVNSQSNQPVGANVNPAVTENEPLSLDEKSLQNSQRAASDENSLNANQPSDLHPPQKTHDPHAPGLRNVEDNKRPVEVPINPAAGEFEKTEVTGEDNHSGSADQVNTEMSLDGDKNEREGMSNSEGKNGDDGYESNSEEPEEKLLATEENTTHDVPDSGHDSAETTNQDAYATGHYRSRVVTEPVDDEVATAASIGIMQWIITKLPTSVQTILDNHPLGLTPQSTMYAVFATFISLFLGTLFTTCFYQKKSSAKSDTLEAMAKMESELFVSRKEKENLEDALTAARSRVVELETEIYTQQQASLSTMTDVQNLTLHNQVLQKNVDQLITDMQHIKEESDSTKSMITERDYWISDLQSKLAAAETLSSDNDAKYTESCRELGELQADMDLLKSKEERLMEQLALIETRKQQLSVEAEEWERKVKEMAESLDSLQGKQQEMQDTITFKDNELEVLRDCFVQLKGFEDDATGQGEDSEPNVDAATIKKKLDAMMDVSKVNAMLRATELERDTLQNKMKIETDAREELEDQIGALKTELDEAVIIKNKCERQSSEAHMKLTVLTNYFKEKEVELQNKLGEHEAIKRENVGLLESADVRTKNMEQDLATARERVTDLENEIITQERDFRTQIATNEKKAHENWLAARASEREVRELKQELSILRDKLMEVEGRRGDAIIRPLPTRALTNGPPPLPPFPDDRPPFPDDRPPYDVPGDRPGSHNSFRDDDTRRSPLDSYLPLHPHPMDERRSPPQFEPRPLPFRPLDEPRRPLSDMYGPTDMMVPPELRGVPPDMRPPPFGGPPLDPRVQDFRGPPLDYRGPPPDLRRPPDFRGPRPDMFRPPSNMTRPPFPSPFPPPHRDGPDPRTSSPVVPLPRSHRNSQV